MSETIERARKSLEAELRRAEAHVEKLRKAVAAMQSLNGSGVGKRVSRQRLTLVCACGDKFHAKKKNAKHCPSCRKLQLSRKPYGEAIRAAKDRAAKRGVTLIPGA